jgi:hypothetical protein
MATIEKKITHIICITVYKAKNNKNIKRFDFYFSEPKNGQTNKIVITKVLLA